MINLEYKIKLACDKKGITITKLCSLIEMSQPNIYKIFKRNSIETKDLEKIAETLDVPIIYFFDEPVINPKLIINGNNNVGTNNGQIHTKTDIEEILRLQRENSRLKDKIIDLLEKAKKEKDG